MGELWIILHVCVTDASIVYSFWIIVLPGKCWSQPSCWMSPDKLNKPFIYYHLHQWFRRWSGKFSGHHAINRYGVRCGSPQLCVWLAVVWLAVQWLLSAYGSALELSSSTRSFKTHAVPALNCNWHPPTQLGSKSLINSLQIVLPAHVSDLCHIIHVPKK